MKVAVFSSNIIDEDIDGNLQRQQAILSSLEPETDLVVLPEMSSTGFITNTDFAQPMNGQTVSFWKRFAIQKHTAVATSLFIKEKDNYFNRHFFFFPNGQYEYYDKHNLFSMSNEPEVITSGSKRKIVEYCGMRIALFTCYDLRFALWCANSYSQDRGYAYDVAVFVASWPKTRVETFSCLLKARAIENLAYVIGVNRVGQDKRQNDYNGFACVIDYKGLSLVQSQDKETISYCTIDKPLLEAFRASFPVGRDW